MYICGERLPKGRNSKGVDPERRGHGGGGHPGSQGGWSTWGWERVGAWPHRAIQTGKLADFPASKGSGGSEERQGRI